MRNIVKLGIFLLVVAGLAGLGLGYVNGITAPLIVEQKQQEMISSFKDVYSQGQEVKDESAKYIKDPTSLVKGVNVAYANGVAVGVIYTVEPSGYNGAIRTIVGFDIATKKVTGLKVLNQSETPGLGARSTEASFQDRFKEKSATGPLEVVKREPASDNQIIAITAATITSKAVVSGVNAARENFIANFSK